jgi:predicted component of type VI protein secretion system
MGGEVRAGRDPAQCTIVLNDGRVSSVHATLKMESGHLYVRDEGSNNGSAIDGATVPPGTWTPVRHGGTLRLGPLEFSVKLEA